MTSGRWEYGSEQQNEQQEDVLDWVEKSDILKSAIFVLLPKLFPG